MVGKLWELTGDNLPIDKILRLQGLSIRGQYELGLMTGCGRTLSQCTQGLGNTSLRADHQVDIVLLENPAEIGLVGGPTLKPLERGLLVSKGFQKCPREGLRIKRLLSQPRYRLLDLYSIHSGVL